jgi:hypothetical protein
MTDFPDVKLKAMVSFPATVLDGTGIDVVKSNGSYQFNLDYEDFAPSSELLSDPDNQNALLWNSATGQYDLVKVSILTGSDALPATAFPLVESGSGSIGGSLKYAREDHVHPADVETFTQTGTGAVAIPVTSVLQDHVFTPEMYGAVAVPMYSPVASVQDCSAAINACITALKARGGGTLQFGPGMYGVVATINIDFPNIHIKGAGRQATFILHKPTGVSTCFYFSQGASILYYCSLSDLTIGSAEETFNKIAIWLSDVSYFRLHNVNVLHYPIDGTMYRGAGTTGTGLYIAGRDLSHIENCNFTANNPVVMALNPNQPAIMLDSFTFTNLFAYTTLTTVSCIQVQTGGAMTNIVFDGVQNWIGGLNGFAWTDSTSSQISTGLHFYNIKSEQAAGSGGYMVNIDVNNNLSNVSVSGLMGGDRNGVRMRKVLNAALRSVYYDPNGNATKIGLNIDSTCRLTEITGCNWLSGTLATISGQTLVQSGGQVTGHSTAIPASGLYVATTSAALADLNGATIDNAAWTAYTPVLTSEAGGALGSGNTLTGFYKRIGKTCEIRVKIITGASGIGAATQFAFSLPVDATGDAVLLIRNRTSALTGTADIGSIALTKAIMNTSVGAAMIVNSATFIISGSYETV